EDQDHTNGFFNAVQIGEILSQDTFPLIQVWIGFVHNNSFHTCCCFHFLVNTMMRQTMIAMIPSDKMIWIRLWTTVTMLILIVASKAMMTRMMGKIVSAGMLNHSMIRQFNFNQYRNMP